MDTAHVRFHNNGPVIEGDVKWPAGAAIPVTKTRADEIVASGDGVLVQQSPIPKPGACEKRPLSLDSGHRDDAVVGIVIPAYNPGPFLEPCLKSIAISDAKDICEVVVVDDASSPPIAAEAARLMREFGLRGRAVRLDHNHEFAAAVNVGARNVAGDHLLMLNVDIEVVPTFLRPMLDELLSDNRIAVVGNLHRLPDGRVDSAGSEWSWTSGTFQHRGRDVKADTTKPAELDMTTWACALVRRDVWDRLGGLADNIYTAYWEDTDFCMSVRHRGHRIRYTPKSEVVHFGRHSSGKGRNHLSQQSAVAFHRRWVDAGRVEGFARSRGVYPDPTRIVVGMIVLNEEEFVEASLDSVYSDVDKIVVVVGGVELARSVGMCGKSGEPTDATMSILAGYSDPDGKLEIVEPRLYPTKRPMRDAILARCQRGDMVLMLDADEVMYPGATWRLLADLRRHDVLMPKREDIWNDLWTVGAGAPWEGVREPRVYRFRPGMSYKDHHGIPSNLPGRQHTLSYSPWAHYAWVKPLDKLRRKFEYYLNHFMLKGVCDPSWFDNVFLRWRGEPEAVEKGLGTHPHGGGATRPYVDRHPPQVERLILEGKIGKEDW